jgi:hypothetical protein
MAWGFCNTKSADLPELPDDFNSSTIMPWACSIHLSQMCASMPAINTAVSAFLRPQKEHSKLGFAIFLV